MFFSQNEDEEIQTNLSQLCGLARIKPMWSKTKSQKDRTTQTGINL
jgi:hypothetical protein